MLNREKKGNRATTHTSIFNTAETPKPHNAFRWSTTPAIAQDSQGKTFGLSSFQISSQSDPFPGVNGGRMSSVIQNDYAKDQLIEMKLNDAYKQDFKSRK